MVSKRTSVQPNSKSALDLLDEVQDEDLYETEPEFNNNNSAQTPFDQGFQALTQPRGEILEMMSRVTPKTAIYLSRSYTREFLYGGNYESGRRNLILRATISKGGLGRQEIIESIKAGQGVPGEFYADIDQPTGKSKGKQTYVELPYDDIEE